MAVNLLSSLYTPKSFARKMGLGRDVPVSSSLEGGRLVVVLGTEPPLTLERLLEQVTEDNIHREAYAGTGVGEEAR